TRAERPTVLLVPRPPPPHRAIHGVRRHPLRRPQIGGGCGRSRRRRRGAPHSSPPARPPRRRRHGADGDHHRVLPPSQSRAAVLQEGGGGPGAVSPGCGGGGGCCAACPSTSPRAWRQDGGDSGVSEETLAQSTDPCPVPLRGCARFQGRGEGDRCGD
ncbi:hypothetical protein EE612_048713, partial [Oryza sativa]